ncbi:hypothetical protein ACJJTC_011923 [Scirpophaga incertulas]
MSESGKCFGCRQKINDRYFLKCCFCHKDFDLLCANVSEQRFLNTLIGKHRANWKCVMCTSKEPKTGNTNTPVRAALESVTVKRGAGLIESPEHMDVSILDTTIDHTKNVSVDDISSNSTLVTEMRLFREELQFGVLVHATAEAVFFWNYQAFVPYVSWGCES